MGKLDCIFCKVLLGHFDKMKLEILIISDMLLSPLALSEIALHWMQPKENTSIFFVLANNSFPKDSWVLPWNIFYFWTDQKCQNGPNIVRHFTESWEILCHSFLSASDSKVVSKISQLIEVPIERVCLAPKVFSNKLLVLCLLSLVFFNQPKLYRDYSTIEQHTYLKTTKSKDCNTK